MEANANPNLKRRSTRNGKIQTPMATMEMVLTSKEFKKMEQLPKLPTNKSASKIQNENTTPANLINQAATILSLPKPLPKCITIKPANTWKVQAENLRKTVEERLKNDTHENKMSRLTIGTQTVTRGFETCGFIQRSHENETFSLSCFNCSAKYELADWQQYVRHYNDAHTFRQRNKVCITSKTNITLEMQAECLTNTLEVYEIGDLPEENDICDAIIEEIVDESDDMESISSWEEKDATVENTAVVNFYTTESARILRFLEVLKAHPVLFHPRRYGPAVFDKEAERFLNAYGSEMTNHELHDSLGNARALQRRFNGTNFSQKAKLEVEPKLKKYAGMLTDIAALSKSYAHYCYNCSYYFLNENDLFKHKFKKHGIGNVSQICSCCGVHFANVEAKAAHEELLSKAPNFKCEHCALSFFTQKKLENHIILSHPDAATNPTPYQCKMCDEKFARQYMLRWHALKHLPPRYKCETCGKAYRKAFNYRHHIRGHLNQRDFICEECGKGFLAKHTLRKHLFKVHKTGLFACTHCKTYFANNENLHDHNQKYHPNGTNLDRKKKQHAIHVKRYHNRLKATRPGVVRKPPDLKCKQCALEFGNISELRKHKRKLGHYTGDRRYKCPHCESILNSNQTFVMHLRKIHLLQVKYSDIKHFQPYTGHSDNSNEVPYENEDADHGNVQYDNALYEEAQIAVQNCANYEEVQYSFMHQ